MEIIFILLFSYLYQFAKNRIIYQCARNYGRYEQCLNKWIDPYGNIRIDLWKCPKYKICQILSRKDEDNTIGVCSYNYKKLYHYDSCSYHTECSSLTCSEGKCTGFVENDLCIPGSFQCENNLVCKKRREFYPYQEVRDIYRCSNLSNYNETCENDNECDIRLVCVNYDIINRIKETKTNNITELKKEIDSEKYFLLKKNSDKKCIGRASLENGLPTENPMACQSGDTINIEIFPNYNESFCVSKKEIIEDCNEDNICIIKINLGIFGDIEIKQNCVFTVRGNPICPLDQKEIAWKKYLEIYEKYYRVANVKNNRQKNIHIPVYKNTFNILEVSQVFWNYSDWIYNIDSDSCTKDFFFLRSKGKFVDFSILYIILIYLLILI